MQDPPPDFAEGATAYILEKTGITVSIVEKPIPVITIAELAAEHGVAEWQPPAPEDLMDIPVEPDPVLEVDPAPLQERVSGGADGRYLPDDVFNVDASIIACNAGIGSGKMEQGMLEMVRFHAQGHSTVCGTSLGIKGWPCAICGAPGIGSVRSCDIAPRELNNANAYAPRVARNQAGFSDGNPAIENSTLCAVWCRT